jgi:predicted nucleic acid-binding protein
MRRAAPKDWADSYLIAFAQAAGFQLVTFDRAIRSKSSGSIYLGHP